MKSRNKGFSLIELIIVVAIMAVLIGILAPRYLMYVGQTKRVVDVNNAQKIIDAMDLATVFNRSIAFNEEMNTWVVNIYYPIDKAIISDGTVFGDAILTLGQLPESKWNKDLLWMMVYYEPSIDPTGNPNNIDPVKKIYLVEMNGAVPDTSYGYELYPNPDVYITTGEKVPVTFD